MSKTYKFNIFKDEREIWTESSLSPFVNIEPIYITSDDSDFIKKVFTFLANIILTEIYYNCDKDKLEFKFLKDDYLYGNEISVEFSNEMSNKSDIINLLWEHKDLCIYQISTGKYWSRIYISLKETEVKGCEYSDDEIIKYIKNKFEIY